MREAAAASTTILLLLLPQHKLGVYLWVLPTDEPALIIYKSKLEMQKIIYIYENPSLKFYSICSKDPLSQNDRLY